MRIRRAERGDLSQIVGVFVQCWTQTYAEQLSSALQQAMDPDRAGALWATALADPASTVLVADSAPSGSGGRVLGVVRFLQERAGRGYLASLYVAPDVHGSGVGRELLTAAEQSLAAGGARTARLWVFAANTGAQEFYRRGGWQLDGERRTQDAFAELELGMTKALPRSAPPRGRTTHDSVNEPPAGRPPTTPSTFHGAGGGAGAGHRSGSGHARSG